MQQHQTIPENNTGHLEKPRFELADILNRYWKEYHAKHNTSKLQRSVA